MNRINVRTINGAKHNGHLDYHHQRIQNRAAAVLDAWDEFGESLTIDLIAHMHRISVDQIKIDLYGDSTDIKKRFGTRSSIRLENALKKCIKEMDEGVNPALVAVAHNIPFKLIRAIENNPNMKEVATEFLHDIIKSNDNEQENSKRAESRTNSINIYSTGDILTRSPLSSIENETARIRSDMKRIRDVDSVSSRIAEKNELFRKKRNNSSTSVIILSSSFDKHDQPDSCDSSGMEPEEHEEPSAKRLRKLFYQLHPLTSSQLKMEWSTIHVRGVGLCNRDAAKKCLNICYINSIIQCLASTAPFVQWLLNDDSHRACQLTADDEFCSVCLVRSIITNIYQNIHHKSDLFSQLAGASAVSLARRITQLSPNFIPGRQEDPSEFLIVLFDHLMRCLASIDLQSYATYLSSPIHFIFGINIQSSIKCTICLNKTSKCNYETVWSIPIISYTNLEEALTGFCSEEKLSGDNSFDCLKCRKKVPAFKSSQLVNISPVIFIHLKRFVYDRKAKITRKIKQVISYLELLDLTPFIDRKTLKSNQENHKYNEFIYQLYAVLVHLGETANNGHIFSYVKSPDDLWYKVNDELVTPINLDYVLADNNSYILCYSKLPEEKLILSETEVNKSCTQSPRFLLSSTPIRSNKITYQTIDDYSPIETNFTFNNSDFDDELSEQSSRRESPSSNESSSTMHENVSLSSSPLQEDLFSLKTQLFPQKHSEPVELQTESRIEIISKINHNNEHLNNLISSGTARSSVSSQSRQTPSSRKRHDSFRNDSSKLSLEATRLQQCSFTSTGSQLNASGESLQDENDFHIQMASSYQFKLQPVDLVKLKSIRSTKNEKKRARVFQEMGLPIEINNTSNKKTIFLSKQTKTTSCGVNNVSGTSGN